MVLLSYRLAGTRFKFFILVYSLCVLRIRIIINLLVIIEQYTLSMHKCFVITVKVASVSALYLTFDILAFSTTYYYSNCTIPTIGDLNFLIPLFQNSNIQGTDKYIFDIIQYVFLREPLL